MGNYSDRPRQRHTLLDLRGATPAFIHISDSKMSDVNALDFLPVDAAAFFGDGPWLSGLRPVVQTSSDRCLIRHARHTQHERSARVHGQGRQSHRGDWRLACCQDWLLRDPELSRAFPAYSFQKPTVGQGTGFLSNHTTLPPLTIAALYKSHWQVGFFQMDQAASAHPALLGTSENTVKTQIWCAVSPYVLIAIVKKAIQLNASLYTLRQILSVSVFENTKISCAIQRDLTQPFSILPDNHFILFTFKLETTSAIFAIYSDFTARYSRFPA